MCRAILQIIWSIQFLTFPNGNAEVTVHSNDIRTSAFRIDSLTSTKETHLRESIAAEVDLYLYRVVRAEHYRFNDTVLYHLKNLDRAKVYIVKISYPASIPSSFSLVEINSSAKQSLSNVRGRRLNTEIFPVTFEDTDSSFAANGLVQKDILIHIQSEGVLPIGGIVPSHCLYDIAVEELLYGFMPSATIRLILWAIFLLIVLRVFVWNYVVQTISLEADDEQVARRKVTQPRCMKALSSKATHRIESKDQ